MSLQSIAECILKKYLVPCISLKDMYTLMLCSKRLLERIDCEDIWKSKFIEIEEFRRSKEQIPSKDKKRDKKLKINKTSKFALDELKISKTSRLTLDELKTLSGSTCHLDFTSWRYACFCLMHCKDWEYFQEEYYTRELQYCFKNLLSTLKLEDTFKKIKFDNDTHIDWCTSGTIDEYDPEIYIHSLDRVIKLPYDVKTITEIINSDGTKAPLGRGYETVMDTSSRNCWQFDTSKFTITNPKWAELFLSSKSSDLLTEILTTMIPSVNPKHGRVFASLYKLLIYQVDSFFKPHVDTQRCPAMFGTLCVTLPTGDVKGGELIVCHNDEQKVFQIDSKEITWAAFYTNCPHEIKKIKSGYRISLVYNLIYTRTDLKRPCKTMTSSASGSTQGKMINVKSYKKRKYNLETKESDVLTTTSHTRLGKKSSTTTGVTPKIEFVSKSLALLNCSPNDTKIAWILSHKYVNKSLDIKYLKGSDRTLCKNLNDMFNGNFDKVKFRMENIVVHCDDKNHDGKYIYACRVDDDIRTDDDHFNETLENYTWINSSKMRDKKYQDVDSFDSGNEGAKLGYLYHTTILCLELL